MTVNISFRSSLIAGLAIVSAIGSGAISGPAQVLHLERSVPIRGIETGDFDHFAVDFKRGLLYTSAQSAHTIEVFSLGSGDHLRSVLASTNPHYIFYAPSIDRIILADGGEKVGDPGQIKLIDPVSMKTTRSFPTRYRTDSDFYDAERQIFYSVSAEKNGADSLMTVIDMAHQKVIATAPIASTNVEGMAIDHKSGKLFLNLRDVQSIGVFDTRSNRLVAQWAVPGMTKNTPMTADPATNRLLVVGRDPGRLYVIDSRNGHLISTLNCANGGDDITYDPESRRLFISAEEGFTVLARRDADHFDVVQHGVLAGGKTSVLVPSLGKFFIGRPSSIGTPAALDIYALSP